MKEQNLYSPFRFLLWTLGAFITSSSHCDAKPTRPYWLHISSGDMSGNRLYRLRQRGTGKIVWSRNLGPGGKIRWSADGYAVAIHNYDLDTGSHWVLIWRLRKDVWRYDASNICDYIMDWDWAPNNRHLLMRVGGSGDSTIDIGSVRCLDTKTKKCHLIGYRIRDMRWAGKRKVLYWTARNRGRLGYEVSKRPHTWLAPS